MLEAAIEPDYWPQDYYSSRERFTQLTNLYSDDWQRYELSATGPQNRPLSIDVASFGQEQAKRVVFVTSGLHGVEAFVGAAVQLQAMQKLTDQCGLNDVAVILIHAVNPYGFAHLRRVNENNIDLNRNFINDTDDNAPTSKPDSEYAALDHLLNPATTPGKLEKLRFTIEAASLIIARGGITPLSAVVAAGQYQNPRGLFYGGISRSDSVRFLQDTIKRYARNAHEVIHLDIHSGLGPFAALNLIAHGNAGNGAQIKNWVKSNLHSSMRLENDDNNPYQAHGSIGQWYHGQFQHQRHLYLCAEFGTYHPLRVFNALRSENHAHFWASAESHHYVKSKRHLRNMFSPGDRRWRQRCVTKGLQLLHRTLHSPPL